MGIASFRIYSVVNFNLRKEKLLFHYSSLLYLGFKDVPIFYNPPVWGVQNVDPPPLPTWEKTGTN